MLVFKNTTNSHIKNTNSKLSENNVGVVPIVCGLWATAARIGQVKLVILELEPAVGDQILWKVKESQ